MKKVVICGPVTNDSRTQSIINAILKKYKTYSVYYNDFYRADYSSAKKLVRKAFNRIIKKIIIYPKYIPKIVSSNIVFLPAMAIDYRLFKLAKIMKKKIVVDFFISMYDTAIDWGKDPNNKRLLKVKKREREVIESSDIVIFLNEVEEKRYSSLVGATNYESVIVPLLIDERESAKLNYFAGNKKTFDICWWGTYIPLHGLSKIIEAARLMDSKNIDFKLHILGNSDERGIEYKRMVESYNLSKTVILRNDITFENGLLEKYLVNNCDLALNIFGDSDKAKNVITHKFLDAVSMKIPVLTGINNAILSYFPTDSVYFCDNNASSIVESIILVMNSEFRDITDKVERNFDIWKRSFSLEAFTRNISKAFP